MEYSSELSRTDSRTVVTDASLKEAVTAGLAFTSTVSYMIDIPDCFSTSLRTVFKGVLLNTFVTVCP
jgi:hypothetical protein